jgi:hypothetical protein
LALPRSLTQYNSISFSTDGTRLAASDAQSVSIFDTVTGKRVMALNLAGTQVAFARQGNGLLAVGPDRAFMLDAPPLETLRFPWLTESSAVVHE